MEEGRKEGRKKRKREALHQRRQTPHQAVPRDQNPLKAKGKAFPFANRRF